MSLGKLLLRATVGGIFVGHGLQKLTGAFGGPGLAGTEKMAESLDLRPARRNALAVAMTETAGGVAIATGTATPVAAAGIIATMVTAVYKVHFKNGLWNSGGGYEYNAALVAVMAMLAGDGPGKPSIDALFGKARWGAKGTLFALAAGMVGAAGVVTLGRWNTDLTQPEAGEAAAVGDEQVETATVPSADAVAEPTVVAEVIVQGSESDTNVPTGVEANWEEETGRATGAT